MKIRKERKAYNIAVVGVTGMVGQEMLEILKLRKIKINECWFYASGRSAGKIINFKKKKYEILELKKENITGKKIDFVLSSVESDLSKEFVPVFAENGAVVIDNSSCFRMDENVPLIVPEVNGDIIKDSDKIIANPNCSTIQAVAALAPLHKKFKIKRIIFSTYQAVSGAGQQGYNDLKNGISGIEPQKFFYPIFNNLIPQIDDFKDDGYTKEEHKMVNETKKILNDDSIKITATTVRVPVFNSHSESINVEFSEKCTADEVREILKKSKGIKVLDDIANKIYPMPLYASGKDDVFVGRIRQDFSVENGINFWVVADNIRKGAATNAVQIMETIIKKMES